jgi:aspartate aminotransferase
VSAPIQHAAIAGFVPNPEIDRYIDDSCRILQTLGEEVAERLRDAGADLPTPTGAFYAFPNLKKHAAALAERGITTSDELVTAIMHETGIVMLPGDAFGAKPKSLAFRLAYVNFDGDSALNAARNVAAGEPIPREVVLEVCPDTISAVDRLADWIRMNT